MRSVLWIVCLLPVFAFAAPEISGTPDELQNYLKPATRFVNVQGYAERASHSDLALVSLRVRHGREDSN